MDIKEFQKKAWEIVNEYNVKHNMEHKRQTVFLHLVEEIGEIARELYNEQDNWRRDFDKEKFAEELIDALSFILILAKDYEVDLELEFNKKINKIKKKFELN
jgi:NTP pyrophosphatase (non-canonical NTP hydrolase)